MRVLWLAFGWANVGIGIAGIVLPLLPTTPFLLVAAWVFARNSDRAHAWLVNHPRLGPAIETWRRDRTIPPAAVVAAAAMLVLSCTISALLAVPGWALLAQIGFSCAVLVFLASHIRRTPRPEQGRASGARPRDRLI